MTTDKTDTASQEAAENLEPEEVSVEERLAKAEEELIRANEERLRAMAELENAKKRLVREKEEFLKYASENILADMLPVLDNLDLALSHGQNNEACKDLVMGVDMTRKVFLETLNKHGLTATGETGEEFNPEFHEAMGFDDSGEAASGSVARVVQKGYLLKGRLLRPAKVLVGK